MSRFVGETVATLVIHVDCAQARLGPAVEGRAQALGWYSILTVLVLLIVGVVVCLAGAWPLERGLRSEFQRRPRPSDDES
jgi:hypothetical protein